MTNFFSPQNYAISNKIARFLSALCLVFLSSCANQSSQTPSSVTVDGPSPEFHQEVKKTDKVALLIPLSGTHHDLGKSLQNAAEMSLFDHAGDQINIATYDTQSTIGGAVQAAQKAIDEGAGLILGPIFSGDVQAIAPLARRAGLNVISFSNNRNIASSGVFALGFSPEEQVRHIVAYAASYGKKSFGVLIPRNAYGALVEREVKQLREQYQLDVEFISYDVSSKNLSHDLNPLKTLSIDALFIPEGGAALSQVISAILYQEIPLEGIQLLGTGQWDDPKVFENHTLRGAWIAAPDPRERQTFQDKYRQAYGEAPNRIATLAYDVISMISVLRRHDRESAFSFASLTQSRGFDGVDGVFRLQQSGVAQRKIATLEVTGEGLRALRSADASF